ncbi:hypothetical protein H8959_011463 [Pygathrix nigripes]
MVPRVFSLLPRKEYYTKQRERRWVSFFSPKTCLKSPHRAPGRPGCDGGEVAAGAVRAPTARCTEELGSASCGGRPASGVCERRPGWRRPRGQAGRPGPGQGAAPRPPRLLRAPRGQAGGGGGGPRGWRRPGSASRWPRGPGGAAPSAGAPPPAGAVSAPAGSVPAAALPAARPPASRVSGAVAAAASAAEPRRAGRPSSPPPPPPPRPRPARSQRKVGLRRAASGTRGPA